MFKLSCSSLSKMRPGAVTGEIPSLVVGLISQRLGVRWRTSPSPSLRARTLIFFKILTEKYISVWSN